MDARAPAGTQRMARQSDHVEDWGGHGPLLVFSHANGFPPGSYRRMLTALTRRFHVLALRGRPAWPGEHPAQLRGWTDFADDLCSFLVDSDARDVVGVGHSLGAVVTLMAAARMPERFRQLTLLDPVALPAWKVAAISWMPLKLRMRGELAHKALTRRDHWQTCHQAFADLRGARAFMRIDDTGLWDHVRAATEPAPEGGVRLAIPRAWEAQVFSCVPRLWPWVDQARVPVRVLRGVASSECSDEASEAWRARRPDHELVDVEFAGHLLPLERPLEVAELVPDAAEGSRSLAR